MSIEYPPNEFSPKELGIINGKPKFPRYASDSARRKSYEELKWPEVAPVSVECLVEAGFVYTGTEDCVRCFYCGGGLRNFQQGDNTVMEHARWYPACPYVTLTKGSKYVKDITKDGERYNVTAKAPDIEKETEPGEQSDFRKGTDDDFEKIKAENIDLKEMLTCKMCQDRFADICFLPCGHLISCGPCAPALEKCSVCSKIITGCLKTYGPT